MVWHAGGLRVVLGRTREIRDNSAPVLGQWAESLRRLPPFCPESLAHGEAAVKKSELLEKRVLWPHTLWTRTQ